MEMEKEQSKLRTVHKTRAKYFAGSNDLPDGSLPARLLDSLVLLQPLP